MQINKMMDQILSQWKEEIQSKDNSVQIETLEDIARQLNELNDKKNYIKFINSDLNYFLSELLIHQHRASTCLVIKILCHISEVPEFFKNDFFRCIRSSLRLINSFSTDCLSDYCIEEAYYKRNILALNTLLLKRAQAFKVNFQDERIPKVSLMITAASLTNLDSRIIEKLEFVNTVLDIFRLMQASFEDKTYQEKKLIGVLKNINFSKRDLLDVDYFVLVAKLLHTAVNFLPATNEPDHETLVRLITEKFTIMIRFTVHDTRGLPKISYEIFLNLFYYIFTSIAFNNVHYMILNYFLTLNGLNFLTYIANSQDSSRTGKLLEFKSRAVISEVMLHILKIFLEVDVDDNDSLCHLREKYLKIILNANLDALNLCIETCDELTRESMLFITFRYYVLMKWNKMGKSKGALVASMAFIMETFRRKKIVMDKGIVSMVFYIYTTSFVNIKVKKNELLENSSAILMRFVGTVNIIYDYNFFKWWFIHEWKDRQSYEKLLTFLLSSKSIEKFENLQESDLYSIDIKFLLKMFLDDTVPVENLEKVTKLLCIVSLNLQDIGKLQTFYEKKRTDRDRRRSIYALKILYASNNKINVMRQRKACDLASKTLRESTDMQERLLAVQLLVKLSAIVMEKKKKK